MTTNLELARQVMEKAHDGQTRWDKETPYSTHPQKVVDILEFMGVTNEDVLIAGYLHDTLEDTELSPKEIKDQFGDNVLTLVQQLTFQADTDDEYIEHARMLSPYAKKIKIADILANLTESRVSVHFMQKRVAALKAMLDTNVLQVKQV